MTHPNYYVTGAKVLDGYRLRLTFADQTEGVVDLSDLVARGGVFRPLKDPKYFRLARADADAGTVVWPNEVDVAPEELYARAHRAAQDSGRLLTIKRSMARRPGIGASRPSKSPSPRAKSRIGRS